jgi:hypothetical protein
VNFWTALIFASLYQDKEVRKKYKINEENTSKGVKPQIIWLSRQ